MPQSLSPISWSSDDGDSGVGAILVTGTSKGIGREICTFLAMKYPTFHLYCGVRKLYDSITTTHNIHPIILDVTKDEHVAQAIETIERQGHKLLAVVNNAGVINVGTVEFTPIQVWEYILDVNVIGTVRVIQAALPTLRRHSGRVVIIGSTAGTVAGIPRYGTYQSSKYALEAVSDSLRKECLEHNVSVSLIQPGSIETDMTDRQIQTPEKDVSLEEREAYPWLYSTDSALPPSSVGFTDFMNKFISITGHLHDTLKAVDHALFDKYPRSRYLTAWLGIGPSWLVVPISRLLPDRVFDWLMVHPGLLLPILSIF